MYMVLTAIFCKI